MLPYDMIKDLNMFNYLQDNSIAGSQDNYYYQCFCGDDYNQTFAVDEAMCTYRKHRLMKIYNTGIAMVVFYFLLVTLFEHQCFINC